MVHPDDPKTGSSLGARWHRFISESYNRRSIAVVVVLAVLALLIGLFAINSAENADTGIPPAVQAAIDKHKNDPPPPGSPPREAPKE
ncbi:hypothetical protein PQ455_14475 [Sphingomonas naphthae]|uniref:SPOR domain-containing protein n=1 Tax=Sphingomonas naphthae TaxID=1813468 RepID=A0ABY7THX5_9SPHN|nr:hypothetical protein [Sphingomonas naphthae]WCT72832.1 hypothetical protein PQ455_14475 [Sphingomonas naphthae]